MVVATELTRQIVRLQREQNGAIHGAQLRAAGLTRGAIRARVARGRLMRVSRDVYIAGDPELMPLARCSAALLAVGPDSVLSHRPAGTVWAVLEADLATIEVTVPGRNVRARGQVIVHRIRQLDPADVTIRSGLRVTSLARTIIDLAGSSTSNELHRALGEARAKHRLTDQALLAALQRAPANHPGAAIVRSMLRSGSTYDRSKAERIVRQLCGQAQLPTPRVNVMLHGCLVDFLWPQARLILEVDGYDTHGNRRAFEIDRRRDQIHAAAGYSVIRVTWAQLQAEPLAVLARIAQALAHRATA